MKDYGEATDVEKARLKERLAVEYVFYNKSSNSILVYLLNCGSIDNEGGHRFVPVSLVWFCSERH